MIGYQAGLYATSRVVIVFLKFRPRAQVKLRKMKAILEDYCVVHDDQIIFKCERALVAQARTISDNTFFSLAVFELLNEMKQPVFASGISENVSPINVDATARQIENSLAPRPCRCQKPVG